MYIYLHFSWFLWYPKQNLVIFSYPSTALSRFELTYPGIPQRHVNFRAKLLE